jgi:predicted nucleic acid-binding protein
LKTFIDSGVLLKAWRGEQLAEEALAILADDTREFVSSQMVRLELLPKPRFEKRQAEVTFYESFFAGAAVIEPLSAELGRAAETLGARYGLSGPDALQIAAAMRHGVQEFYTTEKSSKPMFRVRELKVISLYSLVHG